MSLVISPYISKDVFFFSGPDTPDDMANSGLINVTIADNEILLTGWTGVFVGMGVDVDVRDCQFMKNRNMETGVTVSETSTVTVVRTQFIDNIGNSPNVSALALAISDANLVINETSFQDNTNYTSQVFAIFRSSVAMDSSCITGGSSDTVIFVSQDSNFSGVNAATNFAVDVSSAACNGTGSNRLFFEDEGSLCFQGGECTGTCRGAASSQVCLADDITTPPTDTTAPTAAPVGDTVAPATIAPVSGTVAPTNSSPVSGTFIPSTLAPQTPPTPRPVSPFVFPFPRPTPFPVTVPNMPPSPRPISMPTPISMPVLTPTSRPQAQPVHRPTISSPVYYAPTCDDGNGKKGKKDCKKSKKGKKGNKASEEKGGKKGKKGNGGKQYFGSANVNNVNAGSDSQRQSNQGGPSVFDQFTTSGNQGNSGNTGNSNQQEHPNQGGSSLLDKLKTLGSQGNNGSTGNTNQQGQSNLFKTSGNQGNTGAPWKIFHSGRRQLRDNAI